MVVAAIGGVAYGLAVLHPMRSSASPSLRTTAVRRGDIVLSASGAGTLEAARERELAFGTSGRLALLSVKVGDHVKAGQLLAQLDNQAEESAYQVAEENLADLTSDAAIGNAQKDVADAQQQLDSAELQLEYLISPEVLYWENEIPKDQKLVEEAQAAAATNPVDAGANAGLQKAEAILDFARDKLKSAQYNYLHDYVPKTFVVSRVNRATKQLEKEVEPPTTAEITKARQDVVIAQGALTDARNLYTALTGGTVPDNASGAGLAALVQAETALQVAQANVNATRIVAPFPGTVIAVNGSVGGEAGTSALITLADLSTLYLRTTLDQSDYAMFKVGNSATIVFDALPNETFTGHVVEVDPVLDASSGSAVVSGLVELDPPASDLLLGMGGAIDVIGAEARNAMIVPVAALQQYSPGKYSVYVVSDGKPASRDVLVGLRDAVNAEIKSGLQVGDLVATNPQGASQQ
jgi:multidrug efflux pump subunit AcrA (membrane-fusion protein)